MRLAALSALLLALGCRGTPASDAPRCLEIDPTEVASFEWRIGDFYERLAARRFNSIATFGDPALREFFESLESFSDYYADLAQDLAEANFEGNRASQVIVDDVCFELPVSARVRVRFVGGDGRPLRWWRTQLERDDRWELREGRWWIIPGKL
jgi:hypothetical protein